MKAKKQSCYWAEFLIGLGQLWRLQSVQQLSLARSERSIAVRNALESSGKICTQLLRQDKK
jgi:hypothetical protein